MQKLVCMAVLTLVLAGCGGEEALTNKQVEEMGEQDALAMLDCQLRKAAEDLGQEEAVNRYADEWMNSAESDGDTVQVILDRDGYACPEYLN